MKTKTIHFLSFCIPMLIALAIINGSSYVNSPDVMLRDTLENPPERETYSDVGSMFNERGYYKSNGFSFDEQERK